MRTFPTPIGFAALVLLWMCPAAAGDELRNVEVGQAVPAFTVRTLTGQEIRNTDFKGKVLVLVYVAAEQTSSERVMQKTTALGRQLRREDLAMLYLTADVLNMDFFRELRDRLRMSAPIGLDVGRTVYGGMGLIVLPTTIIIDRQGRLAHVISSYRSNYPRVLDASVRHALGLIDDKELDKQLSIPPAQRDVPAERVARHRAAARVLRSSGLAADAERELRAALEIDATNADARLDLASLLIAEERLDEAQQIVEQVMAAEPANRRGKLMHGIVLYRQDRLDEAEAILEDALLLNPDPVRTHYYLGMIRERRGDEAAALKHYREALDRLMKNEPP